MLLERFDVAAYGPQTMAFLVSRERIAELGAALRALFEAEDLGPYRKLWDAIVPEHLAKKAAARWVVPTSVVRDFCALAGAPASLRNEDENELRVHPENLFLLEHYRSYLEVEETREHPALDSIPDLLARLKDDALPDGWLETPVPTIDEASVLEALRDELDPMFDPREELRRRLNVDVLLEALVGPYVMSRGPGPFMDAPAVSEPLEATGARVLAGAAVTEAIAETERATPSRAWWFPDGEMAREIFDERYGGGRHAQWMSWDAVQSEWPRCRARFIALLEEARAKDEAVLLVPATISSQGHGTLRPQ